MKKNVKKEKFPGFPPDWSESYWKYPRMLAKYWCMLNGGEQKILDFILRQTFGYGKLSDKINSTQFRMGIGENNNGVGLDRKTIRRGLEKLEKMGFIWKKRLSYWVNEYGPIIGSKRDNDGVKKGKFGVKNTQQGVKNGHITIDNNNKEYSKEDIEKLFSLYKEKICPEEVLDDEARKIINKRSRVFTCDELEKAIDNFSRNNWRMENNSGLGIKWFFKSDEQVHKWLKLVSSPENRKEKLRLSKYQN